MNKVEKVFFDNDKELTEKLQDLNKQGYKVLQITNIKFVTYNYECLVLLEDTLAPDFRTLLEKYENFLWEKGLIHEIH